MNSTCRLWLRWLIIVLSNNYLATFSLFTAQIGWEFSRSLGSAAVLMNNSIFKSFFASHITISNQEKVGHSFNTWLRNCFSEISSVITQKFYLSQHTKTWRFIQVLWHFQTRVTVPRLFSNIPHLLLRPPQNGLYPPDSTNILFRIT